jgi:butyryl-CoA dehydrogenase
MSPSSVSAVSASSASNSSLSSKRQYTTHSQLPEEHQMIYEMCRNFANEELAPNAGEWDQKHAFPAEAITHMVRHPKR